MVRSAFQAVFPLSDTLSIEVAEAVLLVMIGWVWFKLEG